MKILLRHVNLDCAVAKLITEHKPKKLVLVTWTLSDDVALYLDRCVAKGASVTVVYAKLHGCVATHFKFKHIYNKNNHAKIWQLDNRIWIGSANLVSDTILNLMLEVKDAHAKHKIAVLLEELISRRNPSCCYLL